MSGVFLKVGFRPFYLGAGCFALLAVPLWITTYLTGRIPAGLSDPLGWHAHEMVFGFAPAVIVGFLLTAARNWTGRPTASGVGLLILFALWLTGRLLNLLHAGPAAALVDAAFLLAAAAAIGVPIWQARNRRNAFVVVLLIGLGAASFTHHAALNGWLDQLPPGIATILALDLILILMTVIGGRVIPAFSGNAVASLQPKSWPLVEALAIALPVLLLAGDAMSLEPAYLSWLAWAAALAHALRLAGWQPWKTRGNVLLLALPLAYAWIPVHLALRGAASPYATHALTVGAMAGLMLAMMTRSALGHTGRTLKAGLSETVIFTAIHLAALARVAGPLLLPSGYRAWILTAGILWTLSFATFVAAYWPMLTRPRVDGRPG